MALPKSKTCRPPLPSGHSPLPLAALSLLGLILCDHIGFSSALKCYQGQLSLQIPVSGSPMDCPMQSNSCIKSVDYSQNMVMRSCQSTNCTVPNSYTLSSSAVCQNSTGYPPQTFCCCYGDGCNSAIGLGGTSLTLLLLALGGATTLLWMHTN